MKSFKLNDQVRIKYSIGKDTPTEWIGKIGTLVRISSIYNDPSFTLEQHKAILDSVPSFQVQFDSPKFDTVDFYLDELESLEFFASNDFETIP